MRRQSQLEVPTLRHAPTAFVPGCFLCAPRIGGATESL